MTMARVIPSIYDPILDEMLTISLVEVEPGLFARSFVWVPASLACTPDGQMKNEIELPTKGDL